MIGLSGRFAGLRDGHRRRMEPDRVTDEPKDARRPKDGSGATAGREREQESIPVEPGPEHDPTTSREAFEIEMAQRGRSDEAQQHGDHIE